MLFRLQSLAVTKIVHVRKECTSAGFHVKHWKINNDILSSSCPEWFQLVRGSNPFIKVYKENLYTLCLSVHP